MALKVFMRLKFEIRSLIEKFPDSRFSFAPPTQQILQFAYEQVQSSEEIARRFLLSTTSRLDHEIKISASKLLDIIQSLVKKHIPVPPYRSRVQFIEFSADEVEDLKQDVHSFAELFEKLRAQEEEQEEKKDENGENDAIPSKTKMVGFSEYYRELKHSLIDRISFTTPRVAVLVGMAGIGKTTLAREFFEELDIEKQYELRLWVKIGRKCRLSDIPRRILAKLNDSDLVEGDDDEEIARRLGECLKGKKYLIVLDDVWNKYTACHFKFKSHYKVFELRTFPYNGCKDESLVLLTTRTQPLNEYDETTSAYYVLKMRLLNKEESWELLRDKVFGEETCPSHLEKAGQKIAENCKGLPLMIVKVAEILSRVGNNTSEFWDEVAARKNNQIFVDAYDQISEVLYPSYEILNEKLKMCFVYMVVFPQDSEIPRSKLVHMWNVDGFLETDVNKFQQAGPVECLNELVSNSLVMIYQTNLYYCNSLLKEEIKTCGLHSSFWPLSRREARKSKFCYVLVNPDDGFGEGMEGQRRLSFHNNVLFGFKKLRKKVERKCASTTRSLLCYGPYQQFQVRICFGLTRLRELDALAIRFYEFPPEVIQLVELKYLALTLNGAIPPSISKLSNLQTLIVGRHLSIRSRGEEACLPVEIWDMKELKHVQVMGSDWVHPCGATLERLVTLSNVGARSCTEDFLIAIPKIQKLGIRIELAYYDDYEKLLSCLNHVCNLRELRSLKCVVLRSSGFVRPPAPFPNFSSWIRKLSLSGLGYPWEEMTKIASSSCLEVLKLRNYAFQGPKWEVKGMPLVHTLVIEDSDLAEWRIGCWSLNRLRRLSLKHCYRLKKIQWEHPSPNLFHLAFGYYSLRQIELVDCNPLGVEQMKKALPPWYDGELVVHSSWNNLKP